MTSKDEKNTELSMSPIGSTSGGLSFVMEECSGEFSSPNLNFPLRAKSNSCSPFSKSKDLSERLRDASERRNSITNLRKMLAAEDLRRVEECQRVRRMNEIHFMSETEAEISRKQNVASFNLDFLMQFRREMAHQTCEKIDWIRQKQLDKVEELRRRSEEKMLNAERNRIEHLVKTQERGRALARRRSDATSNISSSMSPMLSAS